MMIAGYGQAAIMISTVALISLCFGFVLLRLIQAMLVDQTVDTVEAVILVLLVSGVMASVLLSWGRPTMIIGPLVGTLAAAGWTIFLRLHERRGEAAHLSAKEAHAWAMLERDPSAAVALEQLAEIMEREGRDESLLGVLEQWQKLQPQNATVRRKIAAAKARLAIPDDPARDAVAKSGAEFPRLSSPDDQGLAGGGSG